MQNLHKWNHNSSTIYSILSPLLPMCNPNELIKEEKGGCLDSTASLEKNCHMSNSNVNSFDNKSSRTSRCHQVYLGQKSRGNPQWKLSNQMTWHTKNCNIKTLGRLMSHRPKTWLPWQNHRCFLGTIWTIISDVILTLCFPPPPLLTSIWVRSHAQITK